MNHAIRRVRCAAICLFATVPAAVLAAGTGSPPPVQTGYTPGAYGYAQIESSSTSGYASTAPTTQGCDWTPSYGAGSTQNFGFPEANAIYWQARPPQSSTPGMQIHIEGQFPNARSFSISVYNSSWTLLGTLSDYKLATQSGSQPYTSQTQPDTSIAYGQPYTANIVFSAAPAQPAANTLYIPPINGLFGPVPASSQETNLMYRVYVPYGSTASGDVPLPALSVGGQAFSSETQAAVCQDTAQEVLQNLLYSIDSPPGQTVASAPQNPSFSVFSNAAAAGLNGENGYMSATATLPSGYLYIVRGKAPTYTNSSNLAAGTVPDVRYWSICQNTDYSTEVVACVGDYQAALDPDGYYDLVVSLDSSAPSGADAAHGFNWMPFGPQSPATLIYRQQLAVSGFAGAVGGSSMGSYTPQIAYCSTSTFQSLIAGNQTPAQIFQGCGGTLQ
jgi:hypothetical protein